MEDYETALHDRIHATCFQALEALHFRNEETFWYNDDILWALCNAQKMDIDLLKPLAALKRIELPDENEMQVAKNYVDAQTQQTLEMDEEMDEMDEKVEKQDKSILQLLYPIREAFPKVF